MPLKKRHPSIDSGGKWSDEGFNIRGVTAGRWIKLPNDHFFVMQAYRNFDKDRNHGFVVATCTSQDDDGLTIHNGFMGARTHSGGYALRGRALADFWPGKTWSSFGLAVSRGGMRVATEKTVWSSPEQDTSMGGSYDSCCTGHFRLGECA